ncbi:uncharacterized protein N7496_005305 [Penicillium cataractarum]|uniref:Asteroid domain-containing protein n=1 Tax=Penicillium cataractarum TaxID=2100454 RepID=A0A9W9SFZ2_9EURO|nr:uncharacterized protein N7496_005305 [Penicillium cataractarum]KAJ5377896.1 hypothetical protein N7496_005305 [Penicillium cataractarum]
MGIPYLTKHLLPYADSVLLGGGADDQPNEAPRVRSVVIDGPSLVYHVYYRLLAWMSPVHDVLDIQPTCNEVSRAVVTCLLELTRRGIEIHKICFDGALPVSKRETRRARIEKSRHRLELSRRRAPTSSNEWREEVVLPPTQLWQGRNLPARWRNLPENPFMVSAVFEDLRTRWNREQILQEIKCDPSHLPDGDYLWAEIAVMVPGEADVECARVSKLTGSAILTNDSDLIVHDLGPDGAVVFLNTVQFVEDAEDKDNATIKAMRLHPNDLAHRLGIKNILRFAYELNENPHLGFSELLRRSKDNQGTTEDSEQYHQFLREYQPESNGSSAVQGHVYQNLDPRVSELFWQYELPDAFCEANQPHIYLGILFEDHSRKCAWEVGRFYRALGYSLLNQAYPPARQFTTVCEFVRRGTRVVAEQITLCGSKTVMSDLSIVQKRLDLAQSVFGADDPSTFWVMFAVAEIYRDPSSQASLPSGGQLERYLTKGFAGQKTEWTDVHFLAQIHAVLYSLRMLHQLLQFLPDDNLTGSNRLILGSLPPLHNLLPSRGETIRRFSNRSGLAKRLVYQLMTTYG